MSNERNSMTEVTLAEMPVDVQGFTRLLSGLNGTPEGAAAGIIAALSVMAGNRGAGRECVSAADPSLPGSRMRFVEERLQGREYLTQSYFAGTAPESGYRLQPGPLVIRFSTNPYSGDASQGRVKLFVQCSGADSPRPVTVARNAEGTWTAVEWSSLLLGVRPPAQP